MSSQQPGTPLRPQQSETGPTDRLPPVPVADGDGWAWMAALEPTSWHVVAYLKPLVPVGQWPRQVAAHCDSDGVFGLATNEDGRITVTAFPSDDERATRTREIAARWRRTPLT